MWVSCLALASCSNLLLTARDSPGEVFGNLSATWHCIMMRSAIHVVLSFCPTVRAVSELLLVLLKLSFKRALHCLSHCSLVRVGAAQSATRPLTPQPPPTPLSSSACHMCLECCPFPRPSHVLLLHTKNERQKKKRNKTKRKNLSLQLAILSSIALGLSGCLAQCYYNIQV